MVATRRDRYIAFELVGSQSSREFASALHAATAALPKEERPQLLFIEAGRGLVRCTHTRQRAVVDLLNGLRLPDPAARVRTIGASGTIRRARMRYFSRH